MLLPTVLLAIPDMEVSLKLGKYLVLEQLLREKGRGGREGQREGGREGGRGGTGEGEKRKEREDRRKGQSPGGKKRG